ncbi:hypothetical protein BV25DRAFT_773528 [Artomyces pyxidatus]|uniref:Uncharacterized protein n=1 Tax=Artomyces pyxidatus TaxID=48021 RepID=A0ACB8SXR0_9AGAM|nr:hypothetical protein BV25DRAFT_773528 [Artomyces pyxidatus]
MFVGGLSARSNESRRKAAVTRPTAVTVQRLHFDSRGVNCGKEAGHVPNHSSSHLTRHRRSAVGSQFLVPSSLSSMAAPDPVGARLLCQIYLGTCTDQIESIRIVGGTDVRSMRGGGGELQFVLDQEEVGVSKGIAVPQHIAERCRGTSASISPVLHRARAGSEKQGLGSVLMASFLEGGSAQLAVGIRIVPDATRRRDWCNTASLQHQS